MKKTKLCFLILGLAAICLTGCNNGYTNPVVGNFDTNNNTTTDNTNKDSTKDTTKNKETTTQDTKKESASKSAGVSVKLENVKYLGTKWVTNTNSSRAAIEFGASGSLAAAAVDSGASGSIVAVMEDGTTNSEIIQLSSNLQDSCKLNPVREVYKCDKGADGAKGTYIVFDWYIDWWKDTDGNTVSLGQILFVGNDGKVYDIFNKNGDVKRVAHTYQKEYNATEYVKFDNSGNIFIIGKEDDKEVVFRWNPLTQELKSFGLTGKSNVEIQEMNITSTGSWIFVQTKYGEGKKESGIYGFDVNGNGTPVPMYENKIQTGVWPVTGMIVDSNDNLIYCISGEKAPGCQEGGIYITGPVSGSYSPNNTKRYFNLLWNDVNDYLKSLLGVQTIAKTNTANVFQTNMTNEKYTQLLNYLKLFCNNKNVEFNLSYFKNKTTEAMTYNGSPFTKDMSPLYKEESGVVLKNEAALKYLLETTSTDPEGSTNLAGDNLFMAELFRFCHSSVYCADYKAVTGTFPLELLFKAPEGEVAYNGHELVFMKSLYSREYYFKFMRNTKGIWGYKREPVKDAGGNVVYESDGKTPKFAYATLTHILDSDSKFSSTPYAGGLDTAKFLPFKDDYKHVAGTPWEKLPYKENSGGVAAISHDKKTILYSNLTEQTFDILAGDSEKANIESIYSFYIDDTQLIYNANKTDGTAMTGIFVFANKNVTHLPINEKIESIVSVK